jgi:hypothetical protein
LGFFDRFIRPRSLLQYAFPLFSVV